MSSEVTELKAGRPPAVKAGGMRLVTKHKTADKPDSDAYDQKYIDQLPEQPNIAAPVASQVMMQKNHPDSLNIAEQVKVTHVKPQPTVEKLHALSKQRQITQPRK